MKQKEERDLENAIAWDREPGNINVALEAMQVDREESEQFFKEAARSIVKGYDPALMDHRRKRVNGNLAKHWFIYEYPGKKEVRLLTASQHINGVKYSFMDVKDELVFSYN